MKDSRSSLSDILSIFVLFNLAIAQPLYDLLSRNSEFFIAKHSKPVEVLVLALLLSIVGPLVLTLIELILGWIHPRLRRWIHAFFIVCLVALIFLHVLKKWESVPESILLVLAIGLGILFWILLNRWRPARLFLNYLSPAVLILPALFLMNSSISKILH